jgi:cysteine desulfurase/selenocysteine lyase
MTAVPLTTRAAAAAPLDVGRIRRDFPILARTIHDRPLVYLDNAATTQKPQAVIDAIVRYYREENANIHRGVHHLSEAATAAYEESRARIARFAGAAAPEGVVFVRGATEAINLVAHSYLRPRLQKGGRILLSAMEHHSNIVPWQLVAEERGAGVSVIPMNDRGELLLEEYERLLDGPVAMVGLVHVSNALGTVNPVAEMTRMAHARGIPVLVDGAQAVPHMSVDVRTLGCDFYVFSAHKMYGPTGVGALIAPPSLLESMPPYQGGGDMIRSVTFERTTFAGVPARFEAGTPNIAGGIAFGEAVRWLEGIGVENVRAHEEDLLRHASEVLEGVPGLRVIGTAREKAAVMSFVMEEIHPHDIGTILDREGIAVRTGHHCAQPVMQRFGVPATARASFGVYNTREEIDVLARGLRTVREVMG